MSSSTRAVLLAGTILLPVAVLLFLVVLPWLRRRYLSGSTGQEAAEGFCIEDLERMRRSGQISENEFRRLRRAALGLDMPAGGKDNSSSSLPGASDDGQDSAAQDEPRADESER